jgi:hypothetical protein
VSSNVDSGPVSTRSSSSDGPRTPSSTADRGPVDLWPVESNYLNTTRFSPVIPDWHLSDRGSDDFKNDPQVSESAAAIDTDAPQGSTEVVQLPPSQADPNVTPESIAIHVADEPTPKAAILAVVLDEVLGEGATGMVFSGHLPAAQAAQMSLAVKIAFTQGGASVLQTEYNIYRHLQQVEGEVRTPLALGVFTQTIGLDVEDESEVAALVMTRAVGRLGSELTLAELERSG